MIDALVISFVIALLRGGKISRFARLDLRGTEWVFIGAAVQYGAMALAARGVDFFVTYAPLVFVASFIPLLYGVWRSRHLPGMVWIGLGLLLNLAVIAANGGQMPVDPAAARRAGIIQADTDLADGTRVRHRMMDETTRLAFLGDVIPIPPPYPRPGVASIGDLLLCVGGFILVQRTMVERRPERG